MGTGHYVFCHAGMGVTDELDEQRIEALIMGSLDDGGLLAQAVAAMRSFGQRSVPMSPQMRGFVTATPGPRRAGIGSHQTPAFDLRTGATPPVLGQ